jgi:hypothetical protein
MFVLSQRHVTLDAQSVDRLASRLALAAVLSLMAFETPIHEELLLAALVPVRIMAGEAGHLRILKALGLLKPHELVGGMGISRSSRHFPLG